MKLTDEVLAEFIILNQELKEKTKRLDEIKAACKERGPFATANHLVSIETQNREGLPGLHEVMDVIERKTLEALKLIRTNKVVIVRVNKIEAPIKDLQP